MKRVAIPRQLLRSVNLLTFTRVSLWEVHAESRGGQGPI